MDESGLFNLQKSPQGVCLACMFAHVAKNNIKTKTQFTEGRGRKNKFRRCNLFSKTALQSNPELASLRVISTDPSLAPSRSKASPCLGIQYECNFSFSRQQRCFGIDTFIFFPLPSSEKHQRNSLEKGRFVQQPTIISNRWAV